MRYYKENQSRIKEHNKQAYRQNRELRRDVPDFVDGSATDLPLLPKEKKKTGEDDSSEEED